MQNFFDALSFHGNWVDLVFLGLMAYFILTNSGFINTMFEAFGFIISLLVSYQFYSFFGHLLVSNFSIPPGIANAAGFFIAWFLSEFVLFMFFAWLSGWVLTGFQKHPVNKILGIFAAILQTSVVFLFIVSLVFAFPVRGTIKQAILDSRSGPFFVDLSQSLEKDLKSVFGEAIQETINFVTIKPESNEQVDLGFKVSADKLSVDTDSEQIMIRLLNQERTSRGLNALTVNATMTQDAEAYGKIMFENGFFAHVSPVDSSTPADRAQKYGMSFTVWGENLAYAPDVYIAHQGLMNSPGHRANILSTDYHRLGIGVIDGGIYGKMFVQEFSD